MLAGMGAVEQSAILDHHTIEQIQMRENIAQVWQMPARDQDQLPAGCAQPLQSAECGIVHFAIPSKGPIVVCGKHKKMHPGLDAPCSANCCRKASDAVNGRLEDKKRIVTEITANCAAID
jgi:hypothetical protein